MGFRTIEMKSWVEGAYTVKKELGENIAESDNHPLGLMYRYTVIRVIDTQEFRGVTIKMEERITPGALRDSKEEGERGIINRLKTRVDAAIGRIEVPGMSDKAEEKELPRKADIPDGGV